MTGQGTGPDVRAQVVGRAVAKLRQTSLDGWLAGQGQTTFAVEQAPAAAVRVEQDELDFTAYVNGEKAGALELYTDGRDEDVYWVNDIEVEQRFRRRGVATALLRAGAEAYGTLHFSTQAAEDDTADDTRHMTPDGQDLCRGAQRKLGDLVRLSTPGSVAGDERDMDDSF